MASLSASAGCNAAKCTDPHCPVHPQSLKKVASEGGFSWTECIPTFGSIIAAGSGVAALLYCAWMLVSALVFDLALYSIYSHSNLHFCSKYLNPLKQVEGIRSSTSTRSLEELYLDLFRQWVAPCVS